MTTTVADIAVADTASAALRGGFLGGGFMAAVHSRAVRAARATPALIAASSPASSAAAASALGIGSAAHDASALIDGEVDVVHVCTPNATHAPFAAAALAAGKHVICEKPLAISEPEARALAQAAHESGLVAAVPFIYRYHPMIREARARIARGELGAVLTLECGYLQDWLLDAGDVDWRVDTALGGSSRAFADIGSHLCDLIEFVTGERIVRLVARTRTVHGQRGEMPVETEDIAAVLFELDGGALGTMLVSQMAPGRKNALVLEVHGQSESLRFAQERPEELWVGRRSGSSVLLRDPETAAPDAARLSLVPAGHAMGYQDAFNAFVADVYAAVRGAQVEGLPTFDDGLRAVRLTEAVLDSAASGRWIEVGDRAST